MKHRARSFGSESGPKHEKNAAPTAVQRRYNDLITDSA
jgi:hypothetical protein